MSKKKKIVIGTIVLLCCCVVVLLLQVSACKEEKRIYEVYQIFSMPSNYPSNSYPKIFYNSCPNKYKLSDFFYVKRRCGIPDEVQINEQHITKNEIGLINCKILKQEMLNSTKK